MKFSGKVDNGPVNKSLNFGGHPVTDPDMDPDPYRDTGKVCLGGGMQPLSQCFYFSFYFISSVLILVIIFHIFLSFFCRIFVFGHCCLN